MKQKNIETVNTSDNLTSLYHFAQRCGYSKKYANKICQHLINDEKIKIEYENDDYEFNDGTSAHVKGLLIFSKQDNHGEDFDYDCESCEMYTIDENGNEEFFDDMETHRLSDVTEYSTFAISSIEIFPHN